MVIIGIIRGEIRVLVCGRVFVKRGRWKNLVGCDEGGCRVWRFDVIRASMFFDFEGKIFNFKFVCCYYLIIRFYRVIFL